jgi:hypothetical protein
MAAGHPSRLLYDASMLVSRGLERKPKNMRKLLKINILQIYTQVFDLLPVTGKKGDFRGDLSPLTILISRELRRKWPIFFQKKARWS